MERSEGGDSGADDEADPPSLVHKEERSEGTSTSIVNLSSTRMRIRNAQALSSIGSLSTTRRRSLPDRGEVIVIARSGGGDESASRNNDDDGADGGDRGVGERRKSDRSSDDESFSSGGDDSGSSSGGSYDSEGSDSEEGSSSADEDSRDGSSSSDDDGSDEASSSAYGGSSADDDDKSHASDRRSADSRTTAPLSEAVAPTNNYSPHRNFRLGVLPIVSHGLAPRASYRGDGDQNCDPNSWGSTLIRRRGKYARERDALRERNLPQCRPDDVTNDNDSTKESIRSSSNGQRGGGRRGKRSRRNPKQKKRSRSSSSNWFVKYLCCQTKKRSTHVLVLSFAAWVLAQCYYFYHLTWKDSIQENAGLLYSEFFGGETGRLVGSRGLDLRGLSGREKKKLTSQQRHPSAHHFDHHDLYKRRSPEQMEELRRQRAKEARKALGTGAEGDDAVDEAARRGGKPNRSRQKGRGKKKKSRDHQGNTRTERVREGCSELEWHSYHFPNCNEVHEIDLGRTVQHRLPAERGDGKNSKAARERSTFPFGFVGAGLWRDVFTCDPRGETLARNESGATSSTPAAPAVLKMMKSEHPYDQRNFQRHRRDALVMERLSSSRHLVPIYGYCANTVLTKAVSHTLDDVVYAREHERVKKWSPHGGYKTKPPLESWMGRDRDGELLLTRESEVGRIRLALGVFRGLVDLHEGDAVSTRNAEWLPIVHADLQSKQYLVDAATGHIYLNDFNRCRFLTKKDLRPTVAANATNASVNETHKEIRGENNKERKNDTNAVLESCPLYIPTAPGAARSPEEYHLAPLSEKLDVYSAGNVLYGIITGDRPWNNERGKHIKAAIKKGERPLVNETIRNAAWTVDVELTRLLDQVYEKDPKKRASAREVVEELERLLKKELEKDNKNAHSKGSEEAWWEEHGGRTEEGQMKKARRRLSSSFWY